MLFRQLDPKKQKSAALFLLVVGLLLSCTSLAWKQVFASLFHLSGDQTDFFHGFSIGLGLSLEICAIVLLAMRNRRATDC